MSYSLPNAIISRNGEMTASLHRPGWEKLKKAQSNADVSMLVKLLCVLMAKS
jgi:hypothetical protein